MTSRPLALRACTALTAAAVLVAGLVVAAPGRAAATTPLSPALYGLAQGVDSSSWQHPHGADVDWDAAVEAGPAFAFVKATEGTGPANRHYEDDVHAAREAGMAVGSYHKARPGADPLDQARAFVDRIQSVGGPQLPPVLDIEIDEGLEPDELVEWTRLFLEETEHLTGRTPIVYTYRHFWITKTGNSPAFSHYPLWIAEYGRSEPTQPMIGGWTEWVFWQRADDGEVPGFAGPVDLNVFAGTRDDLGAWIGPVEPAQPETAAPEAAVEHDPAPEAAVEHGPAPDPAPEAAAEPLPAEIP